MGTKNTFFKKGDPVCFTWGVKDIFKVVLKPRFKSGIECITIEVDGRRREMFAQSCRKALPVEVERKQRIDDSEELKRLGGKTALIDLFGVDVIQTATKLADESINCDGVTFTRHEAIAALKAHEREAVSL